MDFGEPRIPAPVGPTAFPHVASSGLSRGNGLSLPAPCRMSSKVPDCLSMLEMIPSPTKLALLTGIVLLAGEGSTHPTRYDQRQEGELNFRANVEDVVLVAVPPKDYIANGMTWLGANFIRHNPNRIPPRTPSKHGFVPTEKSPYKVDLGKSTVPVMKLQSPVVEEIKLYKIRDAGDDQSKVLLNVESTTTENKTVKKELKTSTEAAAAVAEEKTEARDSTLVAVGVQSDPDSIAKLENCGPMAHRDSTGKCVYE
ncbi:UNVERIFIED_CONTAM: hypothetical protein PYX00_005710 [Menopon gallinae]|uniref:Uncharacterized protein n=1 Tax=Menopon gallinae TaxID=328185 RepID=A0AAW2HSQ6_9NEOP